MQSGHGATWECGVLQALRVDDFDTALQRVGVVPRLDEEPHVNPATGTREFALRIQMVLRHGQCACVGATSDAGAAKNHPAAIPIARSPKPTSATGTSGSRRAVQIPLRPAHDQNEQERNDSYSEQHSRIDGRFPAPGDLCILGNVDRQPFRIGACIIGFFIVFLHTFELQRAGTKIKPGSGFPPLSPQFVWPRHGRGNQRTGMDVWCRCNVIRIFLKIPGVQRLSVAPVQRPRGA